MEVVCILIAKTREGRYFALVHQIDRQYLRQLRKQTQFYCPQCEEQVLLKVGEVNIPHFAHRQNSTCQNLFTEGESVNHLAGKRQLYHFFNGMKKLSVQLEPYLPLLKQRPDLLVITEMKKIPIEFQCSRIAVNEMKKRTAGYRNAHKDPIWIIQTPHKLKQSPQGIIIYSLSHFEEQFLQSASVHRNYFLSYDPTTQKFHYLSALLHVKGRKFIVNHRSLPIGVQCFPFAEPKELTIEELEDYYSLYMTHRLKFLQQRIFYNRKGVRDSFLRQCYKLRLIPSELPEWIGVPLTFNRLSNEHAAEWQLALIYFLERQGKRIEHVTRQDLYDFLCVNGQVESAMFHACERYISFLLSLGVRSSRTELSMKKQGELKKLVLVYLQSEMKIEKI